MLVSRLLAQNNGGGMSYENKPGKKNSKTIKKFENKE